MYRRALRPLILLLVLALLTAASGSAVTAATVPPPSPAILSLAQSDPALAALVSSGTVVTAIAAGDEHTCALTAKGQALCWGRNDFGQLGDGTTASRNTPAPVSGLDTGVLAIAAGSNHTCAITAGGAAHCWGHNNGGQLGDGTATNRLTPTPVSGLGTGVAAITGGYKHSCALTEAGAALCWGDNDSGQLGDSTKTDRPTPVPVSGLSSGVAAIDAGLLHSCALTATGAMLCWGANDDYQLGNGTNALKTVPFPVEGLDSGMAAISAGDSHSCAINGAGAALCWGDNTGGQLGFPTSLGYQPRPKEVTGLTSGMAAIAAGQLHTCALTAAGAMFCWGSNSDGRLGDGTTDNRLTPAQVLELSSGVGAIAAGVRHTCAIDSEGRMLSWGGNSCGQLGDGTNGDRATPGYVFGLDGTWPYRVHLPLVIR